MSDHQHDWRRDPYSPIRTSYPPQHRIVCAECGLADWRSERLLSNNPKTWPKEPNT